jgi:hypothetical protein
MLNKRAAGVPDPCQTGRTMRCIDPRELDQLTKHVRPRTLPLDPAILQCIQLLGDKDRMLMELTLLLGASRRQMAVALRVTPGNVSRRLRCVARRLNSPLVKALAGRACTLPPQHQQIGIDRFLKGISLRQLMQRHDLTYEQLKGMLEYIRGWHRGTGRDQGLSDESRRGQTKWISTGSEA